MACAIREDGRLTGFGEIVEDLDHPLAYRTVETSEGLPTHLASCNVSEFGSPRAPGPCMRTTRHCRRGLRRFALAALGLPLSCALIGGLVGVRPVLLRVLLSWRELGACRALSRIEPF